MNPTPLAPRVLLALLVAGTSLSLAAEPLVFVNASDPANPQVSYDQDPYLASPPLPENPTVIYSESGAGAGTVFTDTYTGLLPVVQTSEPDTYSRPEPKIYYTAPVQPPGPYYTSGVPLKFDFGPGAVAPGYTQVRKTTAYGPLTGYGWGDVTKVDERDRGGSDPLTRDFCLVNGTPFYVDLPDGNYRVTCVVGDSTVKSATSIRANGLFEIASIGAPAGQYATNSFPIKVTGGRLRFEFFGSINHINAITIVPMTDAEWNRPTIFLAGDSTVSNYPEGNFIIGWGQRLPKYFTNDVVIDNQAKGGRSSRSFYEEGSLDVISNRIKPGDHLLVMFAINDSADESPNYRKTNPATTFKAYLRLYVDAARSKGAVPVFVTSQIKCTYDLWGRFFNSVQGYPQAMRELGAELNVPVIELNRMSIDDLTAIGVPAAKDCFAIWPTDGHWDYIHPNDKGANRFAALVAKGVKDAHLSVAQHLVTVPGAPANPVATTVSTTEIALSWTAAPRADTYNIKRSSVDGGPYTTIATGVTGTTFTDSRLAPATSYYYVVSAVNVKGEGPNSVQTQATTLAGPPAVTAGLCADAGDSQITLTWTGSAGASGYEVKRATTSGGPYAVVATTAGATYRDETVVNGTTYYYVVASLNAYGSSADTAETFALPAKRPLHAHLKFDEAAGTFAADASGRGNDAALVSGPLWTAGVIGNAVDLDGTNDYVALPAGTVAGLADFTLATWVNLDTAPMWSRVFDFGTGTNVYMFLTPLGSDGKMRFAITSGGIAGEQQILGSSPIPTGGWHHVAVTLTGGTGVLYLDGVEVGRNAAMTVTPASLGSTTRNWIGRSQFADPYLNGRVDDFRIYGSALGAAEIASLANLSNTAPALSSVANQTVAENGSNGPVGFTLTDSETASDSLLLSASTSDPSLVPGAGIVFGGSGAQRTVTITPAAGRSGVATITMVATDGAASTATSFTLTVVRSPSIAAQPAGRTVTEGASVTFSITANGTSPFNYQWKLNGADIAGATGSTFTIASTRLADAGDYTVTVGNAAGNATSAAARLIVNLDAVFTGRAAVLAANILGITYAWSDTGPRPDSGGAQESSQFSFAQPGLLSAEVAHAFSLGQGDRTRSEASAANLVVTISGVTLTADFVMSQSLALWNGEGTTLSGSSEITRLTLAGQPVAVTGAPNQTIPLLGGRLVINEQIRTGTEITVNALHLVLDGQADVVIASAQAGFASLVEPPPADADHVSGGGWITGTPSGGKAHFGFDAGTEASALSGHLTYKDQDNGMRVKGTGVTAYGPGATPNSRRIEGTAEVDGAAGFTYVIEVSDQGEPGNADTFAISLSNGYQAAGMLGGGNIQLYPAE